MARILEQGLLPPRPCSYLDGQTARMEHRVMLDVTPEEMDVLLSHGWRHFGPSWFRPRCLPCEECVSLRIPVATFQPSKSQRRALRKCEGITVHVGPPSVDDERLALYRAWHATREDARGWDASELTPEEYRLQFCFPHPCARELAYRLDGRLVALGIVDQTPTALSSVYFFFHPDEARRSIGTASVCMEVALARQLGLAHVYLGYRVEGCASLRYKGTFHPHEVLVGRPPLRAAASWVLPGGTSPAETSAETSAETCAETSGETPDGTPGDG